MPQHRLLVCTFKMSIPSKTKLKCTARLRTSKLRDRPACATDFKSEFDKNCGDEGLDSQTQSTEEI